MIDLLTLMILGIGLGGFMFYVFLPLIGLIFNLGPKPEIRMPIDYVKKLHDQRENMKMSQKIGNQTFKDYCIPNND